MFLLKPAGTGDPHTYAPIPTGPLPETYPASESARANRRHIVVDGQHLHRLRFDRSGHNVDLRGQALGDVLKRPIRRTAVQGRTESTAVKRWCETARDKRN